MQKRNIGRFTIDAGLIEANPDEVANVFALLRLVPIRVEHLWHLRKFEYIGISERFREVPDTDMVPDYMIEFQRDALALVVTAHEVT